MTFLKKYINNIAVNDDTIEAILDIYIVKIFGALNKLIISSYVHTTIDLKLLTIKKKLK